MEEIVNKALEKDRKLRYQSAAEIRTDLQRFAVAHQGSADRAQAEVSAPRSSSSVVIAAARQYKWGFSAGVFAVLVLIAAAGFGIHSLLSRTVPRPFQQFTITQITNSGKVELAAISPDARYLLTMIEEDGMRSLWLRNVPSGSNTQVIAPSASYYASLAFSPDGNYIYFRNTQYATRTYWDLYRVPILGGTMQRVGRDVDSYIGFSPDGQRIAFIRSDRLVSASSEGNNEQVLDGCRILAFLSMVSAR